MLPITFLVDKAVNTEYYSSKYHMAFTLHDKTDYRGWLTADQHYQDFWDHVRMNVKDCRILFNSHEYTLTLLDNTQTGYYLVDEDDRIVTSLDDRLLGMLVALEMVAEVENK